MKKVNKTSKLFVAITLFMLAFFCSFSVTYSYFTAYAENSGNVKFSNFDVRFVYFEGGEKPTGSYTQDNLYTIRLYPLGGTIALGEPFMLASTADATTPISYLLIKNMISGTSAYVRFWIDAYPIVDDYGNVDTAVNYGKFFFFEEGSFYPRGLSSSNHEEAKSCYFYSDKLAQSLSLKNTLTFQDTDTEQIPTEVLGAQLKITITLQAVQTTNGAFRQVFNDNKGYCTRWT